MTDYREKADKRERERLMNVRVSAEILQDAKDLVGAMTPRDVESRMGYILSRNTAVLGRRNEIGKADRGLPRSVIWNGHPVGRIRGYRGNWEAFIVVKDADGVNRQKTVGRGKTLQAAARVLRSLAAEKQAGWFQMAELRMVDDRPELMAAEDALNALTPAEARRFCEAYLEKLRRR